MHTKITPITLLHFNYCVKDNGQTHTMRNCFQIKKNNRKMDDNIKNNKIS